MGRDGPGGYFDSIMHECLFRKYDGDDCWCFNVLFKNCTLISAQNTCFFTLLPMEVRMTDPGCSSRGESNPGRRITSPTPELTQVKEISEKISTLTQSCPDVCF